MCTRKKQKISFLRFRDAYWNLSIVILSWNLWVNVLFLCSQYDIFSPFVIITEVYVLTFSEHKMVYHSNETHKYGENLLGKREIWSICNHMCFVFMFIVRENCSWNDQTIAHKICVWIFLHLIFQIWKKISHKFYSIFEALNISYFLQFRVNKISVIKCFTFLESINGNFFFPRKFSLFSTQDVYETTNKLTEETV